MSLKILLTGYKRRMMNSDSKFETSRMPVKLKKAQKSKSFIKIDCFRNDRILIDRLKAKIRGLEAENNSLELEINTLR